MKHMLLKGGHVIDPANDMDFVSDVLISGGKISALSPNINLELNEMETVDLSGKFVVPGLIDCHVHLREPGYEEKETIETGSRSAAMGGFTTIICEPNTRPPIDTIAAVEDHARRVVDKGMVNIFTKACITNGSRGETLTDMEKLSSHSSLVAFSDDGNPVLREEVMERSLQQAAANDKPVSPHCEDSAFLSVKDVPKEVLGFIPRNIFENESNFVKRDIKCVEGTGCHLHFSHMSLKESLDYIAPQKGQGTITCEATPHHLLLDKNYRDVNGALTVVNPPLRSYEDVQAMKRGLSDGVVDVIASDHAPHTLADKNLGAPGIIGLETTLGVVITELVRPNIISLRDAVMKMSTNPARIFKIPGGSLLPGMDANVTIIDMEKEWVVNANAFESKSRNCPFDGWKLKGKAVMTIVAGEIVMRDGKIVI
ncbi:MAG: dihydroorotase [Candidatus Scalindua sp. AMX11]|nr:MAG: dihydroorotase [Candidatus Scalindua sp.]NOG83155.1 dihydroorotase [Planctomycetota bacterium]RZV75833.1 MAG: dihydroorotase [Candidatus Scalindua sp. SCAELEC01]TDE64890.1 MAG: dihydroorotase [Candidatus Scalindua sp. AMX11]